MGRVSSLQVCVFLHLHPWSQQFGIAQVKILAFALYPSVVRSLLCVSRTDITESCWCSVIALWVATAVLGKKKSSYVHTTFLHFAHQNTPCVAVTEDTHLSQVMSSSTRTNSMNRRDLMMRKGEVTPIALGGSVSRNTMRCSLPALPSAPSDQFYDTMEITNPTCKWNLPAR